MRHLAIEVGAFRFVARLEEEAAPRTCAAFMKSMPFSSQVIHVRWSGEAVWIPQGELETDFGFENHTSHPSRGDVLWYPGGISETEILFAYGSCQFASKMGQLAGNHFMTVVEGDQHLLDMGRTVLWKGAQSIRISDLGER